ncbi:MAG: hypothetical protein WCA44_11235 [Acidobacteriaceae bacterium]
MNAAEHMVEAYFRLCRNCFTISDRKVAAGNNRQLDILAYDLRTKTQFHIEVSVTHRENWCCTFAELTGQFERKFLGVPPKRDGAVGGATDFEKGKTYLPQIETAYVECGFSPADVKRVWICWMVKGEDNSKPIIAKFGLGHPKGPFEIEVLSLRDYVLPALEKKTGTANYDDEILRIIGFMKERAAHVVAQSEHPCG